MKNTILTITLVLSVNSFANEFNYSAYELKDADVIFEESKLYDPEETEGQSVLLPSPKLHLIEKIVKFPYKCDTTLVPIVLVTIGVPKENVPPINYCMTIETTKGEKLGLYIQDSIAKYVNEEYEIGSKIHLWVMWLFVNSSDRKPYFLVNSIGE